MKTNKIGTKNMTGTKQMVTNAGLLFSKVKGGKIEKKNDGTSYDNYHHILRGQFF